MLSLLAALVLSQATVIEDPRAAEQLKGEHVFTIDGVDPPHGRANVTEASPGELHLSAHHKNVKGEFVRVTGRITKVTQKTFELEGTVKTSVRSVNDGKVCERTGHFTFRVEGPQRSWRLQALNTCGGRSTVDVAFERPSSN